MNKESITAFVKDFIANDTSNIIPSGVTKIPEYIGRHMYEEPIIGFASADDDFFASLIDNKAANIDLMQPKEWLPEAKTVISVFAPLAEWMRKENRGGDWPSIGWFYGRINGQITLLGAVTALADKLKADGHLVASPLTDPRLRIYMSSENGSQPKFTSNWSERHIAYAAGLGTFGICGGIITEKGMAGRLYSIITSLELEPTTRNYTGLLDYCILCGKCVKNCPGDAIDLNTKKKDHDLCNAYLKKVRDLEEPFYGCGKCSCDVPCEFENPAQKVK